MPRDESQTPHALSIQVGERLRALREARAQSTTQAAASAGVSEVTWRKWESGQRWPGPENLAAICEAFGLVEGKGKNRRYRLGDLLGS